MPKDIKTVVKGIVLLRDYLKEEFNVSPIYPNRNHDPYTNDWFFICHKDKTITWAPFILNLDDRNEISVIGTKVHIHNIDYYRTFELTEPNSLTKIVNFLKGVLKA